MTDEIALNKAMERGARAQSLLDNELLTEAFATLETEYVKAWRYTKLDDQPARERLWQAVHLIAKVREHLEKVIAHGNLAHRELAELEGKHGTFKS